MCMKYILLFTLTIVCFFGCNNDDDNSQTDNLLLDEWILVSFVNDINGTIITENDVDHSNPISNETGSITINFLDNSSFTGNTGRNEFSGYYELNNLEPQLILLNYISTEVNESDWGWLFVDNLYLNYNIQTGYLENNFEVSNETLKIYYTEGKYMNFVRL